MYAPAFDNQFAADVRAGLTRATQKTLPCRYFYDDVGSALFEAITGLPEYGLTRADARVIQAHAAELIGILPANLIVAELGSGTGMKTRPILEELRQRQIVVYYPIDVSGAALLKCKQELNRLGLVFPLETSYLEGLQTASHRRAEGQTLLVLFLGSTIGNFESDSAIDFLYAIRQCLQPGDALLLGTDMVKPVERLKAAYDDPTGVTAAFNLNLLGRINRELEADFDLRQFEHVIRYTPEAQRIEMHLRSRVYQIVSIKKADLIVDFVPNETICTEACHKFRPEQICEMARTAGYRLEAQWIDEQWPFAENLLVAV
ncbi:MAG TPA: L-histidine N(alpha)-methyltransferase [Candidatus Sulfopaludibacter sp.]|jgi:dimethylhistidine N-methyltransferase|nr:L-histidine N(alpha)-methyltransferase [Candidatus Sulfopaludibacter sp.]